MALESDGSNNELPVAQNDIFNTERINSGLQEYYKMGLTDFNTEDITNQFEKMDVKQASKPIKLPDQTSLTTNVSYTKRSPLITPQQSSVFDLQNNAKEYFDHMERKTSEENQNNSIDPSIIPPLHIEAEQSYDPFPKRSHIDEMLDESTGYRPIKKVGTPIGHERRFGGHTPPVQRRNLDPSMSGLPGFLTPPANKSAMYGTHNPYPTGFLTPPANMLNMTSIRHQSGPAGMLPTRSDPDGGLRNLLYNNKPYLFREEDSRSTCSENSGVGYDEVVEKRLDNELQHFQRGAKPWMNEEIIKEIASRDELFQRMKEYPNDREVQQQYRRKRNMVVTLTRRAKREWKNDHRRVVERQLQNEFGQICLTNPQVTSNLPSGQQAPQQAFPQQNRGFQQEPITQFQEFNARQNAPTGTANWAQNLERNCQDDNYRSNSPFRHPIADVQSYDNQNSLFNKRDNREVMKHNHTGVFGAPPGFSGTDKISLLRRNPDMQHEFSGREDGNESPSGFPGPKPFNQLFKK